MSDVLTNEEIESLMQMVNSAGSELHSPMHDFGGESIGHEAIVSPVDLLKPNRISNDNMRDLERMFQASARPIGATMSDQLRYTMHCDCVAVEEMRFSSWTTLVGGDAAIYILQAPQLQVPLFFSVTKNLLYGWVDRVLGGHGQVEEIPEEFSETEFAVADKLLHPIFQQLVASMEDLIELEVEIEDRFTDPGRLQVLPAQDVVLSVHFQAGSDLLLGDLRIALAHSAIEPFFASLRSTAHKFTRTPGTLRDVLAERVRPVSVDLSVELGTTEMTLRQILAMGVGDVVCLDQRWGDPMVAPVQGVPKFAGKLGTVGSRLGFQIASVLE